MLGPLLNLAQSDHDTFTYDNFSEAGDMIRITVGCKNADRFSPTASGTKANGSATSGDRLTVSGFLQGDIDLSFDSKWDSILGGSGSMIPDDALNIIDLATQAALGQSVRQPWFARSVWRGNSPLKIPVTMHFLALTNAKTEVWDPLWNLVRLFLPRLITGGFVHDADSIIATGITALTKDKHAAALLQQIVGTYAIPGPSVFYPLSFDQEDVMFCYIGNLAELTLNTCFFTDLKLKIPTVFTKDGFPTYAEASFTVNSQDNLFIDANGNVNSNVATLLTNEQRESADKAVAAQEANAATRAAQYTGRARD